MLMDSQQQKQAQATHSLGIQKLLPLARCHGDGPQLLGQLGRVSNPLRHYRLVGHVLLRDGRLVHRRDQLEGTEVLQHVRCELFVIRCI